MVEVVKMLKNTLWSMVEQNSFSGKTVTETVNVKSYIQPRISGCCLHKIA